MGLPNLGRSALAKSSKRRSNTTPPPSSWPTTTRAESPNRQADLEITKQLKKVLELLDIRVLDHIIIAGGDVVSFAERGIIKGVSSPLLRLRRRSDAGRWPASRRRLGAVRTLFPEDKFGSILKRWTR
jgi:RadC-like JAB domain